MRCGSARINTIYIYWYESKIPEFVFRDRPTEYLF